MSFMVKRMRRMMMSNGDTRYKVDTKAQQHMQEEFLKIKEKLSTPKNFTTVMQELTQWLQTRGS